MRRILYGTTAAAVIISGWGANFGEFMPVAQAAPAQPFCRNAPLLAALPKEPDVAQAQQQDPHMAVTGRASSRSVSDAEVRAMPTVAAPAPPAPPPPPPPSYAAPTSPIASSGAVAERGDGASAGVMERSVVRPPYPRRPQPTPQAGLLTAGEHDDLLNPELYAAYVKRSNLGQDIRDLQALDTMNVVTVEVKDRRGQAVSFADVKIICEDGNSLSFSTQADGRVAFFPDLDRLSPDFRIEVSQDGRMLAPTRRALLTQDAGGQVIGVTAAERASFAKPKALDLMLVIDTTGSMGDELRYLQTELRSIVNDIAARHKGLDVRVGFVFYRDEGDAYVTQTHDFDSDMGRVNGRLARERATGGGDYPEAMDQALNRALHANWRKDAVKSLLLVADAPPHDDKFGKTWAAAEAARAKRIHITPVAASGVADKAEYAMRSMAALTQSRYTFLTDDSGVGNPHAPPAVACYQVTALNALLRRVIDSQISGRRVEPEKNEVIRSVGQYDKGKCILPADFRWQ